MPNAPDLVLGRDPELSRLSGWVDDVVAGRGRAALVEGELGIGKSTLVRAAGRAAADRGCQVFWGAGDELGQALPLLPLLEALRVRESDDPRRVAIVRTLRGEFTHTGPVSAAAEQLVALVDELCATPAVLVIDDLQWADDTSLAVWERLARAVRQLPLLLIGVLRAGPRSGRLAALRRAVGPGSTLRLGRLTEPSIVDLVSALAGGRPGGGLLGLAAGAAGNPLYLTELVGALARGGGLAVDAAGDVESTGQPPTSLSAAIADRLGFLPEPVRQVLRAAALLGGDFTVPDLAVVSGRPVAELAGTLAEARAAGVLTGSLAFRHPLIRTALYDELPAPVRAAWHLDAGRALADAGASVDRVARQVLPAVAGTPDTEPVDPWVVRWLHSAAAALVGQAPQVAVELLRRAVPGRSDGVLASRLADALYRVGDPAAAEKVASRALLLASDPDVVVDLHWTLTQCRTLTGTSSDFLPEALAAAEPGSRHRARLLVLTARTHWGTGHVDTAARVAAEALDLGTAVGDRWATSWALHVLTIVAMTRGAVADALPLFERALAEADAEPGLTDLRLLLQINQAGAFGELDRQAEALAAVQQVGQLADRTGNVVRLAQAHSALGQLSLDAGRWDDALAEVDVLPAELKDPAVACCDHGVAAVIGFHRSQPELARGHLAAAGPYADRIGDRLVGPLALARSLDHELAGEPAAALAVLGEARDLLPEAVRLAVALGDRDRAGELTLLAERLACDQPVPHRLAVALHCRGQLDGDPAALLLAADRYQDSGRALPRAVALEAGAAAFAEHGDKTSARAAYARAFDAYTALGATWDLARLGARLRTHGIRRGPQGSHRRTYTGWDSLTPTEVRIAALVVEGLSNPQIGARLFLSPRTVGTHVSHILAKLGVHSRIDIARESGLRASS
ncbi:LuxR family transcriptional regulator [Longispora fulva]|uniref:DNA-binding CsgD family transcriptional regulator n=1 Tax=Longispora fulva TaxID=619741 RepID=A0A8J7GI64_9ACTN|nr:LuxR family transcriptional regulator [Longispora fulva]MBG6137107.1 DNA-binding CsgD family transcriptional regulator [Longispora fulva]GIG61539.1 LuxR family transcriptional regulator [Longispora fulva]